MTVVARTVRIPDPGDLLARLPDDNPLAWIRHGDGLIAWGEAQRIPVATGDTRFAAAGASLQAWFESVLVEREVIGPGTGPVAFASFTFDWRTGGSSIVVPRAVVGRRDEDCWMTVIGDQTTSGAIAEPVVLPPAAALPPANRVRYAGATISELAWLDTVAGAVRSVVEAGMEKVVLARDLKVWAAEPLDVRVLARRMSERFDGCWTFVHDGLVGATPELLVRRTPSGVESIVLAGSTGRGRDLDEDKRLGEALLASTKDQVEHELAVASVVDGLRAVCSGVRPEPRPTLLRLANVQHLATRVTAALPQNLSALALAGALHPTAAVCGTPRLAAMEFIRNNEGMDRGRYSGPVGWVDAQGNGEFGIALRCAEVTGSRSRLFAGAGIVGQSLPELELEETRLKLRAMQSALEVTAL